MSAAIKNPSKTAAINTTAFSPIPEDESAAAIGELPSQKGFLKSGGIPVRYSVALAAFINVMYLYMLRLNVNITLVAMINYTAIPHSNVTPADECSGYLMDDDQLNLDSSLPRRSDEDGEFAWDEQVQSLISVSFFWGYIVAQLLSGRAAEMIGTRWLIASAQAAVGIVTLFFPLLARTGVPYLVAGRVLLGIAQGVMIPALQPLVARWAPHSEKNSFTTFIFSGAQIGTIFGILFSGMMADSLGWEAVFYVQGSLAVVVILPWLYLVYDSPANHPRISENEREYILSTTETEDAKTINKLVVPWKSIATSAPCWALLVVTMGNNWAFYVLLVELPIYMKTILQLDLKSNALLSSVPWLAMWLVSLCAARLADFVSKKSWATTTTIRKTANSIAHIGTALCLVAVSFLGCDRLWTLILLTLSVGIMGVVYAGFLLNHLDLAPNLSGTLYGLVSAISSICSWLAPLTVATLTEGQQTLAQWRIVFLICAGILVLDNVFYLFFGSGERQDWDRAPVVVKPHQEKNNEKNSAIINNDLEDSSGTEATLPVQ